LQQYKVTGMSCAACSARVEKAVLNVDGVTSCSVSLLTNSMGVEGTADELDILKAVSDAGYSAEKKNSNIIKDNNEINNTLADTQTPQLKSRLLTSIIFLTALMYFSMGHSMLGLPLPDFFNGNYIALGLVQLLLSAIVMIINQKFFVNGFRAIYNKSPNMDSLVALGSGAAFAYSTYALFAMTDAQIKGNVQLAAHFSHELYFESAAMILSLITVGKMLESHSKGKTTNALKSLIQLKPKTAVILSDNKEITISAKDIKVDDIFIVKPGESFPTDGVITDGHCAVNESALTGESIPVDKSEGDNVYAATINQSGYVLCRATKTSEDTTLSQIIQMVSDAAATKAPIAKAADKVSGIFVPFVITISVICAIVWLFLGESVGFSLARAISVLVISCPCALGLATPVAIMVGNGVGAKNSILFKTAASLEETGRVKIIALDKTGTITTGEPVVTDILPYEGISQNELLSLAYSLEIKSEHPLAKAIVKKAEVGKISPIESDDFTAVAGNGLSAKINGKTTFGGNFKFINEKCEISSSTLKIAVQLSKQGKTVLYFSHGEKFIGLIAVADKIKGDSPSAISELQKMGLKVVMLTGDNERTANAIKDLCGVDEVIAEVLPSGKEEVIRKLKTQGKTAMVGDGINDALALTTADIGIAIGAGTDVAIDAADVVLMKSRLSDVPAAIRLSRAVLRNIHENLFWAFIYNVVGIPLAAGVFIPVFGLKLNPMFGAAAMSLSSFCVVTNALRLNLFDLQNTKKYKKIKFNIKKENKAMEITMKIEGMMCMHCEARVKKCLEEIEGVTEAIVSHEQNNAIIKLSKDVSYEILKKTIEEQGYTVID